MMAVEKAKVRLSPPYAPWSEMKKTLGRLRRFRPRKVDVAFLQTHRIASGNERSILNALKYLGLIDAGGTPSDRLATLQVEGERFTEALRAIVEEAYADLLTRVDVRDARVDTLSNYFLTQRVGPSVAPKCSRFFIGIAAEAGMELSAGATPPAPARGWRLPGAKRTIRKTATANKADEPAKAAGQQRDTSALLLEAKLKLFERLPNFDSSWKPEAIEMVFREFHRLADRLDGRLPDESRERDNPGPAMSIDNDT